MNGKAAPAHRPVAFAPSPQDSRLTALRHRLRPSLRASLQHDVHEGLLAILSLVGRTSMHGVYNKTLHFQHAAGQRSTRHRPSCEDVAVEELACLRVYPPQWRNASLRDANEAEAARIRACRGRVPLLEMVQGEMRGSSAVEAKCSKCGDKVGATPMNDITLLAWPRGSARLLTTHPCATTRETTGALPRYHRAHRSPPHSRHSRTTTPNGGDCVE